MTIISAMFDAPKLANQSTNINQLTPDWVNIASQGKGSLLDGAGVSLIDPLTNTVTSTYGITSNQSAKFSAGLKYETLSYPNPDIPKRGEITPFKGFIGVTARGGIEYWQSISDRRVEFCESIKKGCVEFLESIKKGSVSATRFVQSSDCLVLRCLRLTSPFIAVTMNWALLSFSPLTCSIASTTSCGTLAVINCDFAFLLGVAITITPLFWCVSLYTEIIEFKVLTCVSDSTKVIHTLSNSGYEISNAPQWWNTNEAFNHSVNRGNSMAMYKSTQTHPEFTWRFAECQENKATYHHVTAHTEDEARSQLPNLPLVFTARIRQEVTA